MASTPYDVAVAYRVYPRVGRTPPVFADNKLKLAELCLRSFQRSLGGTRVKIWALLDACPPEYEALFRARFAAEDLVVLNLPGEGNLPTFVRQIEILSQQTDADLIYFAEDDYYYFPDQFPAMVRFLRAHADAHFVTPYDHLDYYTSAIHRLPAPVRAFEGRQWQPVASSCLTFLGRRDALLAAAPLFRTYLKKNTDMSLWQAITRHQSLFPVGILRVLVKDPWLLRFVAQSWYFGWRQILFGQTWNLWKPTPTVATHMEKHYLPPGFNWPEILAGEIAAMEQERR